MARREISTRAARAAGVVATLAALGACGGGGSGPADAGAASPAPGATTVAASPAADGSATAVVTPAPAADATSTAPVATATATDTAPAPAAPVAVPAPAAEPSPAPAPAPVAVVDTAPAVTAAPAPQVAAPAPSAPPPSLAAAPAPAPASGVDVGLIPVSSLPTTLLQAGTSNDAYWVEDGVWAPWGLTRGGYTGIYGTNYEQYTGVSPKTGANGEVAFRMSWKWPRCCTEIKAFPSIVSGRKPGWYNTWTKPGGLDVQLPDGSFSQTFPSGATPGTFFPLALPISSLKTSFNYQHVSTPSGRGHLAYDIFLQSQPNQLNGFGATVTHEIMVPLDNWGGYGVYPTRNPGWYDHDVTIDGILFHVYAAKDGDGALRPSFNGGWKFIVFQPDRPIPPGTLDLAKFVNYVTTRRDAMGTPWAYGNEYAVSVELGVEPHEGEGDIQVTNYRVWQ